MISVSPGWCRTGLGRTARVSWYQYPAVILLMLMFGTSVKDGADNIVFCAAARNIQHLRGKFVKKRKVENRIEKVLETHQGTKEQLWCQTEDIIKSLQ